MAWARHNHRPSTSTSSSGVQPGQSGSHSSQETFASSGVGASTRQARWAHLSGHLKVGSGIVGPPAVRWTHERAVAVPRVVAIVVAVHDSIVGSEAYATTTPGAPNRLGLRHRLPPYRYLHAMRVDRCRNRAMSSRRQSVHGEREPSGSRRKR
jgi:hypothetical protein